MATPIPDNSAELSLDEILAATGGAAHELVDARRFVGVSTDSRSAPAGGVFVALRGGAHDGHDFVGAARARGATVLVASGAGVEGPRVEVADTLLALGQLARAYVARQEPRPVLAVGGAAGKTTTKTLAAAAVGALFGETLATAGNLNNRIGVPMTLFTLEARHRALVLECGTSEKGEIAALGAIARPDVALVTNVGVEHSAGLGSIEEIADEEADLLLAARRVAVTSAEEPLLLARLARASAARHVTFGLAKEADVRLISRTPGLGGKTELLFRLGEGLAEEPGESEVRVSTPLLGAAAAVNVAAALCAALVLLERTASAGEVEAVAGALGAVEAVPGRLSPRSVGKLFVLDDSYNSNPKSVPPALAAAREVAERRDARLVVALGDMLELGSRAGQEHQEMVALAANSGAALLVLVGEECGRARGQLSFSTPFRWYPDSTAAAAAFPDLVAPDDVVLVKGSRGVRMERLIESLG